MTKIDDFKDFIRDKPELAKAVRDDKTTWQKLYETYDLYGKESDVWETLIKSERESSINIKNILSSLGNIDTESFQKNIGSVQKAIGFFEELTKKDKKENKIKKSNSYKTIDKFYSD